MAVNTEDDCTVPPGTLNPKRTKTNTNLYLWMGNVLKWGPALGHLLQVNTKTISAASAGHRHPPMQHSPAALGRNLMGFVWKAFKTCLTDIYSQSCLERKPTQQPKLCLSSWYLLKQVWCSLQMMIGFDATFKPFLFKLQFLESGISWVTFSEFISLMRKFWW